MSSSLFFLLLNSPRIPDLKPIMEPNHNGASLQFVKLKTEALASMGDKCVSGGGVYGNFHIPQTIMMMCLDKDWQVSDGVQGSDLRGKP